MILIRKRNETKKGREGVEEVSQQIAPDIDLKKTFKHTYHSPMRNFLTIICLLSACSCFGQSKEQIIAGIKQEFKTINSDSSLRKKVLNNEEFQEEGSDGGGKLTGFYKGTEIRKIVSWIGLSNGNQVEEFYFKDGKLIFVYRQFNSFVYDDKLDKFQYDKTERTFEGRYYFSDGKLIDMRTTGHNMQDGESYNAQKSLLGEAAKNQKLLASHR